MTTTILETSILRFCGVNFHLPTLKDYELFQLFDAIVDHGSDLVERHSALPLHIQFERKETYRKQLAENSLHVVQLNQEVERRETAPANEPDLCDDCKQLPRPIDPRELCDDCVGVANDFEGGRYTEPDFYAA